MSRRRINGLGRGGIVQDIKPATLPPQMWSNGQNIRLRDGKILAMLGSAEFTGTLGSGHKWAGFASGNTTNFWLYSDGTNMYAFDGIDHYNITRSGGYNASNDFLFDVEMFGGVPIINNGVDVPSMWSPVQGSTQLVNLPNWPVGFTCQAMRGYKSFLFALNVNKGGVRYPHMVKWSHPASPGAVPETWDIEDPTKDAGEASLDDTNAGQIQDALTLGDAFAIYKENSIWTMSFIGGPAKFNRIKLTDRVGLWAKNTLTAIPGRVPRHFFMGLENWYVFNGSDAEPIFDNKLRNTLRLAINLESYRRCFSVINPLANELWFCFPEAGETWPTQALVWHYPSNTTTFREIGKSGRIASGLLSNVDEASLEFADGIPFSDEMYFDDNVGFAWSLTGSAQLTMFEAETVTGKLWITDIGNRYYGSFTTRYIERRGLAVTRSSADGTFTVDRTKRKLVTRLWAHLSSGNAVIKITATENPDATIDWDSVTGYTATPAAPEVKLAVPVAGRFIAVRIEAEENGYFEMDGYDIEVDVLGDN